MTYAPLVTSILAWICQRCFVTGYDTSYLRDEDGGRDFALCECLRANGDPVRLVRRRLYICGVTDDDSDCPGELVIAYDNRPTALNHPLHFQPDAVTALDLRARESRYRRTSRRSAALPTGSPGTGTDRG